MAAPVRPAPPDATAPRLSVQVVTWNSADVLDACLASLHAQTSPAMEVIVVDNASTDGSAEVAERWFARGLPGTLRRESGNTGFCAAQNRALEISSGDWVLFLNPDAELPADFVERALAVVDALPPDVGTVSPLILLPDGRVDSTGIVVDRFGRAYDRGRGEPSADRYRSEEDVPACTGAAALHRREMLQDVAVGGLALDENLFAYYDDLDLSWRARLRGWRCRYVPALVARHRRAGRNSLRAMADRPSRGSEQALTVRNRYLVMAKCERFRDLLGALPWLVPFELARPLFLAWNAPGALRGYALAARGLPEALRQRRVIQAGRETRRGPR